MDVKVALRASYLGDMIDILASLVTWALTCTRPRPLGFRRSAPACFAISSRVCAPQRIVMEGCHLFADSSRGYESSELYAF